MVETCDTPKKLVPYIFGRLIVKVLVNVKFLVISLLGKTKIYK
jgi:hypothetical protein